jgi:hypothetical protein
LVLGIDEIFFLITATEPTLVISLWWNIWDLNSRLLTAMSGKWSLEIPVSESMLQRSLNIAHLVMCQVIFRLKWE